MTGGQGVYIEHKYGHAGGNIKVQSKSGNSYRSTSSAMLDKCRYNETRFAGEHNDLYTERGEVIEGGYRAAFQYTSQAAQKLASENVTGRSKGKAYIYDSTINPGAGRLSEEAAHRMAQDYRGELEARGYKIDGYQYAIHQGTEHTHIHTMYASSKTLQLRDMRPMQAAMRQHVEHVQAQEISASLEAVQAHDQQRDYDRGDMKR